MPPRKDNGSAETLLKDMAHDSQIRTTERSKILIEEYEGDLDDIEDKIDEKILNNTKDLSAIRQEQLARLLTLVRKRTAIETAITESHARITQDYDITSAELRRCLKSQEKGIKNAIAAASHDAEEQVIIPSKDGHALRGENKENEIPLGLPPPPPGAKGNVLGKIAKRRSLGTTSTTTTIRTGGHDPMEAVQK